MFCEEDKMNFNRYTNLDSLEWRILDILLNDKSKHGENLWKMLAYPTQDCLLKDNLSREEKLKLIFQGSELSNDKKVFLMPYTDDTWTAQSARLDIFVEGINPDTHLLSTVIVGFEILVHNKITNILGDADSSISTSNPSELTNGGDLLIPIKNRATTMLKSLLAVLNGKNVNGVGYLQHNNAKNMGIDTQFKMWNNKGYFGFHVKMFTLMSGISESSNDGY